MDDTSNSLVGDAIAIKENCISQGYKRSPGIGAVPQRPCCHGICTSIYFNAGHCLTNSTWHQLQPYDQQMLRIKFDQNRRNLAQKSGKTS